MKRIVVGVDGSAGSRHALQWAANEARLRDAPLTVLLVWQWPAGAYGEVGLGALDADLFEDLAKLAEQRLDEICTLVAPVLDGLDLERRVVEGAVAPVLVEAAGSADLLVLGTRGHGGFAGLLLGSVSQQCIHHSPCPTVVVPPR